MYCWLFKNNNSEETLLQHQCYGYWHLCNDLSISCKIGAILIFFKSNASKMHRYRPKIHLKSPLASMPPSKGPFSTNIHPIIPKFMCPYLRACALGKWWGPPSKMHGYRPKIHLKSPLAPQPVPFKLASMPPSKGPFSANIHPIIPKLSVPIPQGMCFHKMVGLIRKCMGIGLKSIWNHP